MVAHNRVAALGVDQGGDGLAGLNRAVGDKADVDDLAARRQEKKQ